MDEKLDSCDQKKIQHQRIFVHTNFYICIGALDF